MRLGRRQFLGGFAALAATSMLRTAAQAAEPFKVWASDRNLIPYKYHKQEVAFKTSEPAGTIVVNTKKFWLYYVLGNGRAIRYGIGVGKAGSRWSGTATIARKAKWPKWTPTEEMMQLIPLYRRYKDGMPGGTDNPLGARAMYLLNEGGVDNLIRIHGTPGPRTIGRATTSGCFRMLNIDVVDLYDRVQIGTRVVVLPFDGGKAFKPTAD